MTVKLFDPYNYDMDEVSKNTGLVCSDPSLAQQQFKDESDINHILKQFNVTGQLPPTIQMPRYGDFSQVVDYHSALNLVIAADEAFMALPATIRSRFDNDPALLLDFLNNPENNAEAQKLGITVAKTETQPAANPKDLGQAASDSAPVSTT